MRLFHSRWARTNIATISAILVCSVVLNLAEARKKVEAGDSGGKWTHKVDLEEDYGIKFRWRNVPTNALGERWLIMEFSAKVTGGYVGVGFSPHGGMQGADIAIGWLDSDGIPHLTVNSI